MYTRKSPIRIRFQRMLLSCRKLKDEVFVAFGLLVVTLLVLVGYVFPGTASWFEERGTLPLVILIAAVIGFLGFLIIVQIIEPVIKISRQAQLIAQGDLTRTVDLRRDDEIGDLGMALNTMTRRIRENVEELKNLSHVAETLNAEINGKIGMLSSLMEISNSIAQNSPLEMILSTALRNCLQRHDMSAGCVILKNRSSHEFRVAACEGVQAPDNVRAQVFVLGEGLVGQLILKQQSAVIDQSNPADRPTLDFLLSLGLSNAVFAPISTKGNAYGLLVTGNQRGHFTFSQAHRELILLMAKHLAIAAFNDEMSREMERRVEADPLTGLFSQSYARGKLQDEVQKSLKEQRPCSFILVGIDQFEEYRKKSGPFAVQETLVKASDTLKNFMHGDDIAARFGESEFAMILPGRNKREAMGLALTVIRKISETFENNGKDGGRLTARAAVVENPIDGMTADELILKSGIILNETAEQGGNRVGHEYHS